MIKKEKPLKLSGALFWRYRALLAETQTKEAYVKLAEQSLDHLSKIPQFAPVFTAIRAKDKARSHHDLSVTSFADLQKEIAKKFKIPLEELHNYRIDTETGLLKKKLVEEDPPKEGMTNG